MAIKHKILIILMIVVLFVLSSFSLVKTHNRVQTYQLSITMVKEVNRQTKGMTEKQIIDYSLNLTAEKLQFSKRNNIASGKANCVGYAQLCSAICNQALMNNRYKCKAKPVVGYITDSGINLCKFFKSIAPNKHWQNFVKDHDFVELQINNKIYYFDPSIYDVLGNNCLTIKTL